MKLLIIEDEQELLKLIITYLTKEGHQCESALNFRDGFIKVSDHQYDCAIIDLNLPGGDGLALVNALREMQPDAGIIIVSVRSGLDERITGLDRGADDYLVKPFNLSELNARLKAVVRRRSNVLSKEMVFEDLTIVVDERKVLAYDQEIVLTKKEFDILIYLARNKNRVVTKDSIAEYLWGDYMDDADSYDFIYAHVKNLRKKLADHGLGDFLKTIYGVGYKFQTN